MAAVGLSLLAVWACSMLALALVRPRGIDWTEASRFVPDVARLLGSLARDASLGRGVRIRLLFLLAYLASPIDLVPDFVPVLGYADDAIVAALALRSVVRHAGPAAIDDHWNGSAAGLRMVRRLAGLERA